MPDNKIDGFVSRPQAKPIKKPLEALLISLHHLWMQLVRFGFSLLYNQLAWSYDAISWLVSLGAWRDWQRASLPYIYGQRVLEIAHGPGHMLLELYQAGFQVTGIDLSSQMGTIARRRAVRANVPMPILRSSAQFLPFAPETFDTILSTFPSEFIFDSLTLQAAHRSLKTDGVFIIVPEAQFTGQGIMVKTIEWLYKITGQRSDNHRTDDIPRQPEKDRRQYLIGIFNTFGFTLEFETIALTNSKVTILIARKASPL